MTLEIKNCADCPFSNNDSQYGRDSCNLSLKLDKDIKLDNWEQLPDNAIHKDCPIELKIELVVFNMSAFIKSTHLVEGRTKSNIKNNTQLIRLAPPPPPIKR